MRKLLLTACFGIVVTVSAGASQYDDSHPVFSPDGRRIAFETTRGGHLQLMTMRADGSQERLLADVHLGSGWPRWRPDGTALVFHALVASSGSDEEWQVFEVAADGSGVRQLTRDFRYIFEPVPSPDGKSLAMLGRRDGDPDGPNHLYVANADGAAPRRLTHDPGRKYHPTWSADSKTIAFGMASVEGNWEIHAVGIDGGAIERITRDIAVDASQPYFSPDGKQIAYVCSDDDGQAICVVDVASRAVREIPSTRRYSPWRPAFSSDGKRIAFDSTAGGASDIYVVEPGKDRVEQLTRKNPSAAAEALRTGDVDARIAEYRRDRERAPGVRELTLAAREAASADPQRALKIARFAIEAFPGSATFDVYGDLLRQSGSWAPPRMHTFFTVLRRDGAQPAWDMYREAQSLRPGWRLFDAFGIRRLGFHYLDTGDLPRALSIFQLFAHAYPNDPWAFEGLGRALHRQGKVPEAIAAYERVLELVPDDRDASEKLRVLRESRMRP